MHDTIQPDKSMLSYKHSFPSLLPSIPNEFIILHMPSTTTTTTYYHYWWWGRGKLLLSLAHKKLLQSKLQKVQIPTSTLRAEFDTGNGVNKRRRGVHRCSKRADKSKVLEGNWRIQRIVKHIRADGKSRLGNGKIHIRLCVYKYPRGVRRARRGSAIGTSEWSVQRPWSQVTGIQRCNACVHVENIRGNGSTSIQTKFPEMSTQIHKRRRRERITCLWRGIWWERNMRESRRRGEKWFMKKSTCRSYTPTPFRSWGFRCINRRFWHLIPRYTVRNKATGERRGCA